MSIVCYFSSLYGTQYAKHYICSSGSQKVTFGTDLMWSESSIECCTGQVMPSRAHPFPQATLPHLSRSRQYGSHYRPAPVHLCPGSVDRAFRNADWRPYGWNLDSGGYVSLSGDWAEEMRLRSASAAQIASALEHLNSPRTSAPQWRRQSYRCHAVTH